MCIELTFFCYGTYGYAILLQAQSSIFLVVPFRISYIIKLPTKYVLVVISSDSIMIKNQNTGYC